jgi:hypothetical protein
MFGRDSEYRSLAASLTRSRQVGVRESLPRSDRSEQGDASVSVPLRRRAIGQGVAAFAIGLGAWLFVTAGDSALMRSELGSDDDPTGEYASLARLLDGVVSRVEAGTTDEAGAGASGDQRADFGAGAGPAGSPPAAPDRIGRLAGTPSGTELGAAGPGAAPDLLGTPGDPDPVGMPKPDSRNPGIDPLGTVSRDPSAGGGVGDGAGPAGPSISASTRPTTTSPVRNPVTTRRPVAATTPTTRPAPSSPVVTAAASTTTPRSSTTATTSPPGTTVAPTTATSGSTGGITTTSTTTTTAAPQSSCAVVVTGQVELRSKPKKSAAVSGQASARTYGVLERHRGNWFRISGGWLSMGKHVKARGC